MRSDRARSRALFAVGSVLAASALAIACGRTANRTPAPPPADPIAHLRAFEDSRRNEARFLETKPQDHAFGPDPYDLATLPNGRVVGILRGRDALVVLDDELREVARLATPRSPSAVAVYEGRPAGVLHPGDVLVASELEPVLAHYRGARDAALERLPDIALGNVLATRALATGPEGVVYLAEEHDDRLITLTFSSSSKVADQRDGKLALEREERRVPRGPIRIARAGHTLFVASLIDHTLSAFPLDARGGLRSEPTSTTIDGPYWGFAAIEDGADALVVTGGAEDHPLDRRGGFFGYVDSFVHVYRWTAHELRRTASINVSEHGLIVPKAIAGGPDGTVLVTSYGGSAAVRLAWKDGLDAPPVVSAMRAPPGASAIVRARSGFVTANPLLDAWVRFDDAGNTRVVRVSGPEADSDLRTDRERLGEALFFTGLMAPASSSEGAKSRFSCETCHFEGYVDGRVHHTGRGDVHATTKPLVGLFNNRPHFSRALDPDLSSVAENEFRVAGAPATADPHFDVEVRDVPWLADLGVADRRYDAAELRLSLMAFLMSWTHRTNPRAAATRAFTTEERAGAAHFRDRCEGCHQARAAADAPASRVAFERWEGLILEGGPIVWGSDAYEKTGIVPYVHERGARVPSLRRLYKKRPYFTNGSAPDLATVLRRVRMRDAAFSHDDSAGGTPLDETTARAIAAFVDLL